MNTSVKIDVIAKGHAHYACRSEPIGAVAVVDADHPAHDANHAAPTMMSVTAALTTVKAMLLRVTSGSLTRRLVGRGMRSVVR